MQFFVVRGQGGKQGGVRALGGTNRGAGSEEVYYGSRLFCSWDGRAGAGADGAQNARLSTKLTLHGGGGEPPKGAHRVS